MNNPFSNIRFILIVYFSICSVDLFGQYDYFDIEAESYIYERVYSELKEQRIIGNVKEFKVIAGNSTIYTHLQLNKKGQIIRQHEYGGDESHLAETTVYSNQKLIERTEYYGGTPMSYVRYKYISDKLITKDFLKSKKSRRPVLRITYQYDNIGRLLARNYSNKKNLHKFIYEGDSVIWKLTFDGNSQLKNVNKKVISDASELIIVYRVDTTSDVQFTQRIKPIEAYLTSRDRSKNVTGRAEFKYDSAGNRIAKRLYKYEFEDDKLVKSTSVHNTGLEKKEYINEYVYNDRGLLELERFNSGHRTIGTRYKYDERGNRLDWPESDYRISYDRHGNWILKQLRVKKTHSITKMVNGVTTKEVSTEYCWEEIQKRDIIYFD